MDLSEIISKNLKQLRHDKKLSLDHVAKLTGVSKSMLGQIERGDVNPTVTTIWKIANGLKISFTALMSRPQPDIELISPSDSNPLIEDNGKFRNYPIFPFDDQKRFEMYRLEIDPNGYLNAEPHSTLSQEFITLFSGEMNIMIGEEEFLLKAGDSIRFKADVSHSYHNVGSERVCLSMVMFYPE